MNNNEEIKLTGNNLLEAIAYLEKIVDFQVNKGFLPTINIIATEVISGKYDRLEELKAISGSGHPDASGRDNDIFSMDAHVKGKSEYFSNVLSDFIEAVEKVV